MSSEPNKILTFKCRRGLIRSKFGSKANPRKWTTNGVAPWNEVSLRKCCNEFVPTWYNSKLQMEDLHEHIDLFLPRSYGDRVTHEHRHLPWTTGRIILILISTYPHEPHECLVSTLSTVTNSLTFPQLSIPTGLLWNFQGAPPLHAPCEPLWQEGSTTPGNLKITQLKRTKLSSKPPFLGSTLVFTGCKTTLLCKLPTYVLSNSSNSTTALLLHPASNTTCLCHSEDKATKKHTSPSAVITPFKEWSGR